MLDLQTGRWPNVFERLRRQYPLYWWRRKMVHPLPYTKEHHHSPRVEKYEKWREGIDADIINYEQLIRWNFEFVALYPEINITQYGKTFNV